METQGREEIEKAGEVDGKKGKRKRQRTRG